MLNNQGFTLIETLFVLFIILVLSTLTMTLHIPPKNDNQHINDISQLLYQAKLNSILYKETTTVSFQNDSLSIDSLHYQQDYILDQQLSFDQYQFTYNEFGHIKKAKTVCLRGHQNNYRFVFQIGSGSFYVQ